MNAMGIARRTTALAAVAVLALVGSACGNGDDDAEETTPTAPTETTLATLSDEEFESQMSEGILEPIAAADDDLCALSERTWEGPAAQASSEYQVELTVQAQVDMLRALAATEPRDEEHAPELERAADEFEEFAESEGYPLDLFERESTAELLAAESLQEALLAYQERAVAECDLGGPVEEDDQVDADDAG